MTSTPTSYTAHRGECQCIHTDCLNSAMTENGYLRGAAFRPGVGGPPVRRLRTADQGTELRQNLGDGRRRGRSDAVRAPGGSVEAPDVVGEDLDLTRVPPGPCELP